MILNKEQQLAVEYNVGPLMIIAGPGTGKTKTLISKIAFLINILNTAPEEILGITFTIKAAKELNDRIKQELKIGKDNSKFPLLTTFHSLAYKILSKDSTIKIIEDEERKSLIKNISNDFSDLKQLSLKELEILISKYKSDSFETHQYSELIESYNLNLKQKNLLDYDDLIINALDSISKKNNASHIKYLLVDEFQDTNQIQYEFIKKLLQNNNIFVIGDPLQSIYSFRGAKKNVFDLFSEDFSNSKKIELNINYRSNKSIIKTGHQLFPNSVLQIANNNEQGNVQIITTLNEYAEADWIMEKISQIMGGMNLNEASDHSSLENDTKAKFSDFAVIYRVHNLNKVLEQKFTDNGIPFQIVGGESIYEKKEVELIINSLKYFFYNKSPGNEKIDKLLLNLCKSEIFGVDKSLIEKVITLSGSLNYQDLKQYIYQHHSVSPKLIHFVNYLEILDQNENNGLIKFVEEIIEYLNIEKFYSEKPRKIVNIYQFLSILHQFKKLNIKESIELFLENLEKLKQNDYYDEYADKVTLLTMHAAKGLEFKYVFIIGFEKDIIPYTLKAKSDEELEEERRLLYVAITRAREGLFLMKTLERNRKPTSPSPFEKKLESDFLERIEDPMIEKIKKRRIINKEKKSQIGMF
jgi:DNA helicase II / ATP-dependent DNA helicase PcrA